MSRRIHPEKLKWITGKYQDLLEATSASMELDASGEITHEQIRWNNEVLDEVVLAFGRVARKVSSKAIGDALTTSATELMREALVLGNNLGVEVRTDNVGSLVDSQAVEEQVTRILDGLHSLVKVHSVLVPISGVTLTGISELRIGDTILYPWGSGPMELGLAASQVDGRPRERINKTVGKADCYVVVETEGESEYALAEALQQAPNVIHLLNLFLATSYHRSRGWHKISIVPFEPITACLYADASLNDLGSPSTLWTLSERSAAFHTHEITPDRLDRWRTWGFDRVVQCVTSGAHQHGIEAKIRQSVVWFSKAIRADGVEESFVAVAIALESLLGGGSGGSGPERSWGSIGQSLADRCAFLIGQNCDERVALAKEVKEMYALRSKIVHEGKSVSPADLFRFERIFGKAFWAFVALMDTQVNSWEDFERWERMQKYSVQDQSDE